jgi:hypothetical protein
MGVASANERSIVSTRRRDRDCAYWYSFLVHTGGRTLNLAGNNPRTKNVLISY